jgi:hypothetical protein
MLVANSLTQMIRADSKCDKLGLVSRVTFTCQTTQFIKRKEVAMDRYISNVFSVLRLLTLFSVCLACLLGKAILANNLQQFLTTSKINMPFITNSGQYDNEVLFHVSIVPGNVIVTQDGSLIYNLKSSNTEKGRIVFTEKFSEEFTNEISGIDPVKAKYSFFDGDNVKKWINGVPAFNRISYGYIYEGIRLQLETDNNNVEKIFIVEPGADPGQILVRLDGISGLNISDSGELIVLTDHRTASFTKPVAYQMINGDKCSVEISYFIADNAYGFQVGNYNRDNMLIIDPLLASTYLGGSGIEGGEEYWWIWTALGPDGSVYVAGMTASIDFPTVPGAYEDSPKGDYDIFVAKLNADLTSLEACTYIGGSSYDRIWSIIVSNNGDVYLSGITASQDYPTTSGSYSENKAGGWDAFVSKLSNDLGSLLASTYIGGNGYEGRPMMAMDSSGNIFLAGTTGHSSFPDILGSYDVSYNGGSTDFFVSKFTNDLSSLVASTFLGGLFQEYWPSIEIDDNGNVYISGSTGSYNYPYTPDAHDTSFNGDHAYADFNLDVCVSKLDNNLTTLLSSTFLGSNEYEGCLNMTLDEVGNVYVSGHTWAANYPITSGVLDEEFSGDEYFISKLDSDLDTLLASTFITPNNAALGYISEIESNGRGSLYIVGGATPGFTVTTSAYDRTFNGGSNDAFFSEISDDLALLQYSTYLGGSGSEKANSLAISAEGDIYFVGRTTSDMDFPILPGAYDNDYNGGETDAFVVQFCMDQFTRITEGEIVNDINVSAGVAWVDYDNDNYPDLYVVNEGDSPSGEANCLYHNNQNGGFTKIIGQPITEDIIPGQSSTWADFDEDGDVDVFIVNPRGVPNKLYENDGYGNFNFVEDMPFIFDSVGSRQASWIDYDIDGDLDLFVANATWSEPHDYPAYPNFLYKNIEGVFSRVTSGGFVTLESHSYGSCWVDFDNDGDPDVVIANNGENTDLYRNNGNDNFMRLSSSPICTEPNTGIGCSWADYDNDGDLDLFIPGWIPGPSNLYRNDGNGNFSKVIDHGIGGYNGMSTSGVWADYDNDGNQDIFVWLDAFYSPDRNGGHLFRNLGNGTFEEVTDVQILGDSCTAQSAVWGDYDRDGDMDLFLARYDQSWMSRPEFLTNALFRNNGNSNNWITIKPYGTISNRSAIGTKVKIKALINGIPVWQMQELMSQNGLRCQSPLELHFGLGEALIIDSIVVEWPSGIEDILTNINVNQFLAITETFCGDANSDEGVNIGDVVYLANHVFRESECLTNPPIGCPPEPYEAGDVNCDQSVNIGDAVYLGNVIFRPGSPDPCASCP